MYLLTNLFQHFVSDCGWMDGWMDRRISVLWNLLWTSPNSLLVPSLINKLNWIVDVFYNSENLIFKIFENYYLASTIYKQISFCIQVITLIKTESSIINNLKQKAPGPDVFTGKFHKIFKKKSIPIPYNLFQRVKAERIPPHSALW